MSKKRLDLATLIGHAGDEIRKAHEIATNQDDAVMQFKECEIEVGFEVELDVGGKVNFWAVEIGATGTQTATNKITLRYEALSDGFVGNVEKE
jgi:hypothetical protein